jgi:hypothetical protein
MRSGALFAAGLLLLVLGSALILYRAEFRIARTPFVEQNLVPEAPAPELVERGTIQGEEA